MDRLTCGWPQRRRGAPPLTSLLTRRAGGPRGRSRGQALVEFALVAPLFLMLLFGIVEYSLINASVGTFNFAAKDAAREGAIIGKGSVTTGTTTVDVDYYMVNNIILPRVSGVVVAQMQKVEIFHADQTGACVNVTVNNVTGCQENIWQFVNGSWQETQTGWQPSSRNDALSNADYLGVKISYTYTYLTAFFAITSPTLNLTALSVQRIEPQQYGDRHDPASSAWASLNATPSSPAMALLLSARLEWLALEPFTFSGGHA